VLTRQQPCQELGPNYVDELDRQAVGRGLVRRLEQLGCQVELTPIVPAA